MVEQNKSIQSTAAIASGHCRRELTANATERPSQRTKRAGTYLPPPRPAAGQRLRLRTCVGVIAIAPAAVHVEMVNAWSYVESRPCYPILAQCAKMGHAKTSKAFGRRAVKKGEKIGNVRPSSVSGENLGLPVRLTPAQMQSKSINRRSDGRQPSAAVAACGSCPSRSNTILPHAWGRRLLLLSRFVPISGIGHYQLQQSSVGSSSSSCHVLWN